MNKAYFSLAVLYCLLSNFTSASSDAPEVHGYLSQSWIRSPDNPMYAEKPGSHFNYRELGLSAGWNLSDKVRVAGEVLYRDAGTFSENKTRLDFLLLDYNFWLSEHSRAGFRVGRIKNEYGIYNSTRDVPHARPGVFVPQSVYFESFRDALLSVDGGSLYGSLDTDYGHFTVDLYGGTGYIENVTTEYQITLGDTPGEFDKVDEVGGRVQWYPVFVPGLMVSTTLLDIDMQLQNRATFTASQIGTAITELSVTPTAVSKYVTDLRISALLNLWSAQYSWSSWTATVEYLTIDVEVSDFEVLGMPLPNNDTESLAYYAQLEWFASSNLSIYGRYEELFYNRDGRDGRQFQEQTGGNPHTQYTKTLTAGARWFFTPDISLTAEYTTNKGAAFINGQRNVEFSDLERSWDALIVQFSYHF